MQILDKLNRILNVSSREWPRICIAWGMTFLARIGFIIGGSVLLAVFLRNNVFSFSESLEECS